MNRTILIATSLAGLLAALPARPAFAQASAAEEQARAHFRKGQELVVQKRFGEAFAEFEAGYAQSPRPPFLFNMGECARLSGQDERARQSYERYLREEPNGNFAKTARERMAEIDRAAAAAAERRAHRGDSIPPESLFPTTTAATSPAVDDAAFVEPLEPTPVWRRWPFWAAVGVVAVVGSLAALSAANSGADCGIACIDLRKP